MSDEERMRYEEHQTVMSIARLERELGAARDQALADRAFRTENERLKQDLIKIERSHIALQAEVDRMEAVVLATQRWSHVAGHVPIPVQDALALYAKGK
jgi:hypothetical protein